MWHSASARSQPSGTPLPPQGGSIDNKRFVRPPLALANHFNTPPPGPSVIPPSFLCRPPPPGPLGPPASACPPPVRLSHPPPLPDSVTSGPPPIIHPTPPPAAPPSHPPPVAVLCQSHPTVASAPPPARFARPPPPASRSHSLGADRDAPPNEGEPERRGISSALPRDGGGRKACTSGDDASEDGSSVFPSAETQRWLSEWFERSGVAQRCSAAGGKKATPKLRELRAVLAGPAPSAAAAADLARLVRRRRQRRAALKQRRQADRQRLLLLHAEIDAWQADIRRREQKRQEEERVRKEADKVLGEVRRKIVSVETHIQTVELLRTLRETRDLKARQAGLFSSASSDQRFSDVAARLTLLLDRHLAVYETELQAMSAMAAPASPPPASRPADGAGGASLRVLFGPDGVSRAAAVAAGRETEQGGMVHMVDWDTRPQHLLNVRSAWDRYLVSSESPLGSGVPPAWVVPTEPCSDAWAAALVP